MASQRTDSLMITDVMSCRAFSPPHSLPLSRCRIETAGDGNKGVQAREYKGPAARYVLGQMCDPEVNKPSEAHAVLDALVWRCVRLRDQDGSLDRAACPYRRSATMAVTWQARK